MKSIMEIESLSKSYGDFLLNDINFKIPTGSITGIIGENGAGKTTLINLILNLIKRDKGNITIFGYDNLNYEKKIKSNIGFVIDSFYFHESFTSTDIAKVVNPIYKNWDNDMFKGYLSSFEIEPEKKIVNLSKGMKSKLLLSVALSHKPKLLILDEVTSGLDPIIRNDVLQVLKEFVSDGSRSVLFSTHITEDLSKVADNIIFLHKGDIIFTERKEELLTKYLIYEHKLDIKDIIIDNRDIVKKYYGYDKIMYLVKNKIDNKYLDPMRKPTIDDIMLLFIKGEDNLC